MNVRKSDLTRKFLQRFIPTGVGNIAALAAPICLRAVHPHGCGEHLTIGGSTSDIIGSSPRVWGTLNLTTCMLEGERFIPTGVGNIQGIPK